MKINYSSSKEIVSPQLYTNSQYNANEDFVINLQPISLIVSGTSSYQEAIKDILYDVYSDGIIDNTYNIYVQKSLTSNQPITYSNNTPLISSINSSGENSASIKWISDGNFLSNINVGRITKQITGSISRASGLNRQFNSIATGSLANDIKTQVNVRINTLTASSATYNLFSSIDDSLTTYVRNTDLWATGIDLTCIPAYNSNVGVISNGILITPDIIVTAYHSRVANGTIMYFVTNTNITVSSSIQSGIRIDESDIWIMKLSSSVPGTITPAKVLSADSFFSKISQDALYSRQIPIIYTNQFRTLRIATWLSPTVVTTPSSGSNLLPWYSGIIGGDSGTGIISIINSQSVALGSWHTIGGFPPINFYFNKISQAITTLGSIYSLTTASLNSFPTYL